MANPPLNQIHLFVTKPTTLVDFSLTRWVQQQQHYLEILLDAYCVLDPNQEIVACNLAFENLVGLSEKRVLKNPDFNRFIRGEVNPENWEKAFSEGQTRYRTDEVTALIKTNSRGSFKARKLIVAAVPITDTRSQRIGTLLTIRDVTDESNVQAERILNLAKSNTDGLTQLSNKSFTELWLTKQLEIARRNNTTLSIMFGDVDHFKKINDTFGHQAGDYVLKTVAHVLQGELRKGDLAGRFGGEEFIIVMSHTNQSGALIAAERIRQKLAASPVTFKSNEIPLTISLGTTTFSQDRFDSQIKTELLTQELLTQCDLALYEAKRRGRNRTCQFELLRG